MPKNAAEKPKEETIEYQFSVGDEVRFLGDASGEEDDGIIPAGSNGVVVAVEEWDEGDPLPSYEVEYQIDGKIITGTMWEDELELVDEPDLADDESDEVDEGEDAEESADEADEADESDGDTEEIEISIGNILSFKKKDKSYEGEVKEITDDGKIKVRVDGIRKPVTISVDDDFEVIGDASSEEDEEPPEPPKKTEAKKTEAKKTEAKKTEAKKTEAKKTESKKTEAKKAEPKKAESKKAQPKKTETKRSSNDKDTPAEPTEKRGRGRPPRAEVKSTIITEAIEEYVGASAEEVVEAAVELYDRGNETFFSLGGVLSYIVNNDIHHQVGYGKGQKGFKKFIEEKFELKYRKARYLIQIYERITEMGIDVDTIARIGWSKLREMVRVNNDEQFRLLLDYAENHTFEEVQERASSMKEGIVSGDGESVVKKRYAFRVQQEECELVDQAIEVAMNQSNTDNKDQAFVFIATSFLSMSDLDSEVEVPNNESVEDESEPEEAPKQRRRARA